MELWTEYEGKTIDGAFPLKKLVSPQGRSALFSTANAKGEQTLIRLVACHFDEDEILARWRGVEALKHPNFLRLERYGQLELDDTKVVYAAFEHTDGSLAHVLERGCISASDTRQLAATVASALAMLHANGFVHEHISAEGVFALGDVVKLRTDCIRETPEGADGEQARKRDVRDFGTLLLQALTQERTLEAAAARRRGLPPPFDQIVPKAITAEWGLAEISAALRPPERTGRTTPVAPTPAAKPLPPKEPATAAHPPVSAKPPKPSREEDDRMPAALRSQDISEVWREEHFHGKKWMAAIGLAAAMILLLWIGWRSVSHAPAKKASVPQVAHRANPALGKPAAAAHAVARAVPSTPHVQWRVVTYTYNRRQDAEKRSAEIAQQHPELHPAVFSPKGHAPYLVTIGGALDRDAAYALARRSRRMGLPRDTYAQNYR